MRCKMQIPVNFHELHSKLKTFESQCVQIDEKIKTTPRISKGAVNFGFYQLNKKKTEIQSKIIKINNILNPDIIA